MSEEFHASKPRSQPETTHGHQPGHIASAADAAPESHAKTLPPGTAPPSHTFAPNSTSETPSQANNPSATSEANTSTSAEDTLTGATSSDVHTGLGHPGSGQTSQELHDGSHERAGLQGVGAKHAISGDQDQSTSLDTESPVPGATKTQHGQGIEEGLEKMEK